MPSMRDFVTALSAPYASPALLELRPLRPSWSNGPRPPFTDRKWYGQDEIDELCADAGRLSELWDVYIGVLPRCENVGTHKAVRQAYCLFADVDGGEEGPNGAIRLIKRSGLPLPHMAVISGGGVHAYWLLSTIIPVDSADTQYEFKQTLKRICRAIGGTEPAAHADTNVAEVARVLRVPGTLNHKLDQSSGPRPVRLIRFAPDAPRYGYDWWRDSLPLLPAKMPKKQFQTFSACGEISPGLRRWAESCIGEGKRHKELLRRATYLHRDLGIPKPDVFDVLERCATISAGTHPVTIREVEDIVEWA